MSADRLVAHRQLRGTDAVGRGHAASERPDGSIDRANGTCEDEVVCQDGVSKIKARALRLLDDLNLGSP